MKERMVDKALKDTRIDQTLWQTVRISKLYRIRNRCFAEYIPMNKPEHKALNTTIMAPGWVQIGNRRAVLSLEQKGLVEVYNRTNEYRLAEPFR